MKTLFFLMFLMSGAWGWASSPKQECKSDDIPSTVLKPVDLSEVKKATLALTAGGKPLLVDSMDLTNQLAHLFDGIAVKTKMEQFYTLLYFISREAKPELGSTLQLDLSPAQNLLVVSGVFSSPDIPRKIKSIEINRIAKDLPKYTISFEESGTKVALNQGKGFYLFRSGKCQHAQALIFRKVFKAAIKQNRHGNTVVSHFSGVDLFGDFGNRGVIDVDINYVAIKSVEFYKGTPNGKVTAYVSDEEFKKNDHNALLRMISKFVPDRSVQPIDW